MRILSKWIGLGALLASTGLSQAQSFDCCTQQFDDCCQMQYGCESDSCSRFFVEGAALIWKPSVHGIPFGITAHTSTINPDKLNENVITGKACTKVNNLKFKWNAGFRAGVGYHLPCAGSIGALWTHYNSSGKGCSSIASGESGFIQSSWIAQLTQPIRNVETACAFAKWNLKLDLLDVKFEKRIECNKLAITPFASIRAGWIQNRYNINIATTNTNPSALPPFADVTTSTAQILKMKSKFEGAGLRGGLQGSYQVCGGLGIYGFGSGSMLYGRYKNDACEFVSGIRTGASVRNAIGIQCDRYCDNLVIGDCGAGIEYKTSFCNDRFALTLQAGWEQNVLFNQVQFTQLPSESFVTNPQGESHDLTLQGFTFSARLDF